MHNTTTIATQTAKVSVLAAATLTAALASGLVEPALALAGKLSNNHNELQARTSR